MSPSIPEEVRARVRAAADDRCGYCRSPQHLVLGWLERDSDHRSYGNGRATVVALQLNNVIAVMVRRAWVSAGWHPPAELL